MVQDDETWDMHAPTAAERALLMSLLSPEFDGVRELRREAANCMVRSEPGTLQDLRIRVAESRPSAVSGSAPVWAAYPDFDGGVVHVELWLDEEGHLQYVECRRFDQLPVQRLAIDAVGDLQFATPGSAASGRFQWPSEAE